MTWRWWVDGIPADSVPVMDRGFSYGDGLFETVAIRDGRIRFLLLHLERLADGCLRLGMPPLPSALRQRLEHVAADIAHGTMKLLVTRGVGERGYAPPPAPRPMVVFGVSATPTAPSLPGRARLCATRIAIQPRTAGLKTLNRLEQVLARAEWQDPDIFEGIVLDWDDHLVGGTASNLFIARGTTLLTPDLSRAGIHGIMRRVVLEQAPLAGIACRQLPLTLRDLEEADEVFVSNALTGLRPVVAIDDRRWPVGAVTRALRARLAAIGVDECAAPC